jgi:ribosomal 50S subunit-associated protein YjgA (DUF615 family)
MGNVTRQDVQAIIDAARNTILQKAATRQDVQTIADNTRDRTMAVIQQQIQTIRQMNYQNIQMFRRVVALESRMATLEHELKAAHQLVVRLVENMPQQIVMPAMPENQPAPHGQQYVYRPA